MTSTTDMTGTDEHPEVAEISALAEGILPPDRSADLRGHLDDCALCSGVRASLDEIRDLLGTLPGPPRMPTDIAGRLDAALAAEALLAATSAPVSRETSPSSSLPDRVDRPAGHSPAPSGPGRSRTRRRWLKGLLVTASAAGVLGLGGSVLTHSFTSGGASSSSADSGKATASKQSSLEARVHALLSAEGSSGDAPSVGVMEKEGVMETGKDGLLQSGSLPSCVTEGIGRSGAPLAFERETYEGIDSYLVVFPNTGDETSVDAYLVDASCVAASPTGPAKVLNKDTYTR